MKWPSGPLEIGRRARAQTLTAEVKQLLLDWHAPRALEILRGSPVNCLIVNWASGAPEDEEQQRTLAALIQAGRSLGISFVGAFSGKAVQPATLEAGRKAGLAAALVEGAPPDPSPLLAIPSWPRSKIPWDATFFSYPQLREFGDSKFLFLSVSENRWPGVGLETMHGDVAVAGPTGIPWVDSNGWFSLLARELGREKFFWLDLDPPASPPTTSWHPADYLLAIADSQAYGSWWIVSLEDQMKVRLLKNEPQATKLWQDIAAALSFFKEHKDWSSFWPQGALAVVSDFRGKNESLAEEVLNLLSRRGVQWRVIERSRASSRRFDHLKFIAWLDDDMPDADLLSNLLDFAKQGGVLIVSQSWKLSDMRPAEGPLAERYQWNVLGSGRIAQSKKEFQDPYEVAADIHLLMSRRNDLVRLFNAGMAACLCTASRGGKSSLVQILDYSSSGPAEFVSLWVKGSSDSARFWTFGSKQPAIIQGKRAGNGMEFELPSFSVYAGLEFGEWGL